VESTAPSANGTVFLRIPTAVRGSHPRENHVNFQRRIAIPRESEMTPPAKKTRAISRRPYPLSIRRNAPAIVNPRSTMMTNAVYSRRSKARKKARNVPPYV